MNIQNSSQNILYELKSIQPESGYAYTAILADDFPMGDSLEDPIKSSVLLFEDDISIGVPHSTHTEIRNTGKGLFSHWHNTLIFSIPDNSNPCKNKKKYHLLLLKSSTEDLLQSKLNAVTKCVDENMDEKNKYDIAEKVISVLVPKIKLSEYGRIFFNDKEFASDFEDFIDTNYRSFDRKFTIYQLSKLVNHIEGDTVECGAYYGASSHFIAKNTKEHSLNKKHHLFDSFEGVSMPSIEDAGYWQKGDMSVSLEIVKKNLKQFNFISYYKGWIPEKFKEVKQHRFSFVHLDVDLYQPTLDAIKFFYPRLNQGGIMVCDDYGFEKCPGAKQAMDEYFKLRPEEIIQLPTGQAFIQKKAIGV